MTAFWGTLVGPLFSVQLNRWMPYDFFERQDERGEYITCTEFVERCLTPGCAPPEYRVGYGTTDELQRRVLGVEQVDSFNQHVYLFKMKQKQFGALCHLLETQFLFSGKIEDSEKIAKLIVAYYGREFRLISEYHFMWPYTATARFFEEYKLKASEFSRITNVVWDEQGRLGAAVRPKGRRKVKCISLHNRGMANVRVYENSRIYTCSYLTSQRGYPELVLRVNYPE